MSLAVGQTYRNHAVEQSYTLVEELEGAWRIALTGKFDNFDGSVRLVQADEVILDATDVEFAVEKRLWYLVD